MKLAWHALGWLTEAPYHIPTTTVTPWTLKLMINNTIFSWLGGWLYSTIWVFRLYLSFLFKMRKKTIRYWKKEAYILMVSDNYKNIFLSMIKILASTPFTQSLGVIFLLELRVKAKLNNFLGKIHSIRPKISLEARVMPFFTRSSNENEIKFVLG